MSTTTATPKPTTGLTGKRPLDNPPPPVFDDPADGPAKLFVYGTLRPTLYPQMATRFGLSLISRASIHGEWAMHNLGSYPALVKTKATAHPDSGAIIVGELVNAPSLANLDGYEGYPGLYTREIHDILLDDGSTTKAWIYIFARPSRVADCPIVTTGDWADIIALRH